MALLTVLQDFVLRQLFSFLVLLSHLTLLRLALAFSLLPAYCVFQALSVLPDMVGNLPLLLTAQGRTQLIIETDDYRSHEQDIAAKQYAGTYSFSPANVLQWDGRTSWHAHRVDLNVCGIKARVIHAKPLRSTEKTKPIIMLHGNPSWSYIWRDIIPHLTAAGHEVFAVDWLGHGTSDKPVNAPEISFELHMHTLREVITRFDLHDFYIAAHDWGGCVALCTVPTLQNERRCKGIFLLNTFLPPRPSDISLHFYLLYWIWFFTTGICGPLLPDSFVLRFMAPNTDHKTLREYSEPYEQSMLRSKTSINRFSHIAPCLPDWVLSRREARLWRLVEGLLGPEHFTNINAQAWLARRNDEVREWWSYEGEGKSLPEASLKVMVLFGRDDPLLPELKYALENTIGVSKVLQGGEDGWLPGAGHYPMEQAPKEIADILTRFLEL